MMSSNESMNMSAKIVSPCVGVCSTALGDSVCRGCQRSDTEITDWLAFDEPERASRMVELDSLREAVVGEWLAVTDPSD